MSWANVWTIFRREVRDQVRDRRTLFMVFVLPILLYPVLGIGMLQFFVAFEDKPRTVVILGSANLPESPRLLSATGDAFDPGLFEGVGGVGGRLVVRVEPDTSVWADSRASRVMIRDGQADAVLTIPADVKTRLGTEGTSRLPVDYVSTDERSQLTYFRVREILGRWNEKILQARLARDHKPADYVEPVQTRGTDLATKAEAGGNLWSRLFPFLLVLMSLTGAFYPAVDLCAGEKERGTMETLLISPATRLEIVLGKFLTVVLASVMTAVLNLASMAATGIGLASQMAGGGLEPPSLIAAAWMLVLLLPLSVFFSAICVALAVHARSMKEGQYYMTPLYMVSLPLILLTLAPGVELTPFYSMVPITGVGLLLRSLILGEYGVARRYFIPVLVPMVIYGGVALRWAVDLFRREDVLFRETERFELFPWLRYLIKYREATPSGAQALLCFSLMISLAWFTMQATGAWLSPLGGMVVGHLIFILGPPVVMGCLLTSSPRTTLRLRWPSGRYLAIGAGLAFTLNPLVRDASAFIEWALPPSKLLTDQMEAMAKGVPNLGIGLLIFAIMPAITEEFAFRGYILSGLLRSHRPRTAILISALLFGFLHVLISLFNQFFTASFLGVVLGLLAYRSASLVPGIVFHLINNGLALGIGSWLESAAGSVAAKLVFRDVEHGLFQIPIVIASALGSAILVAMLVAAGRGAAARRASGVDAFGVGPTLVAGALPSGDPPR